MRYDVIVIGAGPAGGTAALRCAEAGMRVALIEKHNLPRHKTCGGGMPMTVGAHLHELAPDAFVETRVRCMRHTFRWQDPLLAPINPPGSESELSLWMVRRSVFDNAIAQRAVEAGVQLYDGLGVRSIETVSGRVTVRASDGLRQSEFTAEADYVIGADGANGITARAAGLRRDRPLAIALEVEHPHEWGSGHDALQPDVAHLEYGAVRRGYAWVFPKGDHLNVGAGLFRPRGRNDGADSGVRDHLQGAVRAYMDLLGVRYRPDELRFHAHPLPIWNGREPLQTADSRILLAGDAAGLINPLFGDGILHAVKSGQIAAAALAEGAARDYTSRIHAEFAANFDAALRLARFFYQWPGLCYQHAVKRPQATRTAARLLCGEALFTDVTGRALRRLRRALPHQASAQAEP